VGGISHNTLTIDGQDQMLHWRRFKTLYRTPARVLRFETTGDGVICEGEHLGYRRLNPPCTHRRAVVMTKRGTCVVVDHVSGSSMKPRQVRVHWQAGPLPWEFDASQRQLTLQTSSGPCFLSVHGSNDSALALDVACGQETPPRGWVSRAYAQKLPAPSLVGLWTGPLPFTCVSVFSASSSRVTSQGTHWSVEADEELIEFTLQDGRLLRLVSKPIATNRTNS
jgi:Heparinase II/III-like protein